jgi:hypothetical protein
MTTSADGTYEISQEFAEDVSEDQVNVTKGLTEAPNQSSGDIDISDPSPTHKGKPRCIIQYFKLLHLCNPICIYYILH